MDMHADRAENRRCIDVAGGTGVVAAAAAAVSYVWVLLCWERHVDAKVVPLLVVVVLVVLLCCCCCFYAYLAAYHVASFSADCAAFCCCLLLLSRLVLLYVVLIQVSLTSRSNMPACAYCKTPGACLLQPMLMPEGILLLIKNGQVQGRQWGQ